MSWLSSFLKNPIQPITHAIGNTVGVTANLNNGVHIDPTKLALTAGALALPGVGALAGKALGGLGGALSAIPGMGAVEGALGSLGGAAKAIPGVSAIGHLLGGTENSGSGAGYDPATGEMTSGQTSGTSGGLINGIEGLLGLGGGSSGSSGSNSGGLLQSIEGLLTGNGGLNALGIAQGVNAAALGKTSSDYAKDALGSATSAYNDKAPLRQAGQAGLLNPQTQDLSGLTTSRNGLNTSVPSTANLPGVFDANSLAPIRGNINLNVPGATQTSTANPQALQSIMALLNPQAGQGGTSTSLANPSSLQNAGQPRANPQALQSIASLLQPQNASSKLGNIQNANTFGRAA